MKEQIDLFLTAEYSIKCLTWYRKYDILSKYVKEEAEFHSHPAQLGDSGFILHIPADRSVGRSGNRSVDICLHFFYVIGIAA